VLYYQKDVMVGITKGVRNDMDRGFSMPFELRGVLR